MNKEYHVYFEYGVSVIPILINSILAGRAGPLALRRFLKRAWTQVEEDQTTQEQRRKRVTKRTPSRRERMQVTRYYDCERRSHRALRSSLTALENYLAGRDETWLEKSLLEYETSERFRKNQLAMRIRFQPMVCERISQAC